MRIVCRRCEREDINYSHGLCMSCYIGVKQMIRIKKEQIFELEQKYLNMHGGETIYGKITHD